MFRSQNVGKCYGNEMMIHHVTVRQIPPPKYCSLGRVIIANVEYLYHQQPNTYYAHTSDEKGDSKSEHEQLLGGCTVCGLMA